MKSGAKRKTDIAENEDSKRRVTLDEVSNTEPTVTYSSANNPKTLIQRLNSALYEYRLDEARELAILLKPHNLKLPASFDWHVQDTIDNNKPNFLQIIMDAFQVNLFDAIISLADLILENKNEIATFLIQKGIHVNQPSRDGITPLCCAAGFGLTDLVRLLIENGALVDQPNKNGDTPLHSASFEGQVSTVKFLLGIEAIRNAPYVGQALAANNNATLFKAANAGDLEFVNHLLSYPEVIDNITANDNAVLRVAHIKNHEAIFKRLFEIQAVRDFEKSQRNQHTLRKGHDPFTKSILPTIYYDSLIVDSIFFSKIELGPAIVHTFLSQQATNNTGVRDIQLPIIAIECMSP